jgi:hypothetical protein
LKGVIGSNSDVRLGSKADIFGAKRYVRFTPNNDRESGFPHKVMSALPPKADISLAQQPSACGQRKHIGVRQAAHGRDCHPVTPWMAWRRPNDFKALSHHERDFVAKKIENVAKFNLPIPPLAETSIANKTNPPPAPGKWASIVAHHVSAAYFLKRKR